MLLGGDPPLEEGERREMVVRAHPWLLIRAALPIPLFVVLPVPYTLLDLAVPALRLATFFPLFMLVLGVALALYVVKWFVCDLLPWLGTAYIVTNRRLI